MNLRDFAEQRQVKAGTVSAYMKKHPEEYAGLTSKKGKELILSNKAIELLDKKYPLPSPVNIINGVPHEEYERVLSMLAELQQRQIEIIEAKNQFQLEAERLRYQLELKENETKTEPKTSWLSRLFGGN